MSKKKVRISSQDGQPVRMNPSAPAPEKLVVAVNKEGAVLHLQSPGMSAVAKDALLFVPTRRYTDDIIHLKHQRLNELNHTLAGFTEEGPQTGSA